MNKALFIDRDGTLITEPAEDFQVDSLEKLEFVPGVIRNLYYIRHHLDYELVMVSNQDGLGTDSFPEEKFLTVQRKMLGILEKEGILFDDIIIDKTFPEENAPTRKPGTALLKKYMDGDYDLNASYVIGDRKTDVQLAKNLGARAIFYNKGNERELDTSEYDDTLVLNTDSWEKIFEFLSGGSRLAKVERSTKETSIIVELNLDGNGSANIQTGLGFFDHMLEQIARHGNVDITIQTMGDLQVDEHHTIEDTALALGEAFARALGDKKGISRYGFMIPMDDCLAQVVIDFGGRPWLVWDAKFSREKIGDMPTEMFMHFFKSFSDTAKCNLHIQASGNNEHHKIEAIFKALGKAVRMAVNRNVLSKDLPTTKGFLE